MSDVVRDQVVKLAEKELAAANEKFPLFASDHEAYAVILEEIEEAKTERVEKIEEFSWRMIKNNLQEAGLYNMLTYIEEHAVDLAVEAIQISAMANKAILSIEKRAEKSV